MEAIIAALPALIAAEPEIYQLVMDIVEGFRGSSVDPTPELLAQSVADLQAMQANLDAIKARNA